MSRSIMVEYLYIWKSNDNQFRLHATINFIMDLNICIYAKKNEDQNRGGMDIEMARP